MLADSDPTVTAEKIRVVLRIPAHNRIFSNPPFKKCQAEGPVILKPDWVTMKVFDLIAPKDDAFSSI
jgi:hypothetical protein